MHRILAINPGSTSTKIGYFEGEHCRFKEVIRHDESEKTAGLRPEDEALKRREAILALLVERAIPLAGLSALVVRGGLLKPLSSGTYLVDEKVYRDLAEAVYGWHASNLGVIIALPLAEDLNIPVYTVDPVTVDEFETPARYSGLKDLSRVSMSHALNMKAVARRAAVWMDKEYEDINLIVVHLGSGISVSAHRRGRMIDVNNANEEGPFSMERCGTLPALGLVRLCFSGRFSCEEMIRLLTSCGGIYSYLGTKDFARIRQMTSTGSDEVKEVVEALIYQVAKEIGAMAAVLKGNIDGIVLTGGMARDQQLIERITDRISFIARVIVIPGEEELEALAAGALRVLRGEEKVLCY
ncbi:MAG: butyrate kinase [Firmicutes bacterium ML8_F2]|nr:MAG: butyrate kinase [Firmicutes bacterium ML8_F2]